MFVTLGEVCERGASNLAQKDIVNLDGEYPIFGASGYIGNVNFYHQEKSYLAVVKDGAGVGRVMLLPAKSSVIGTMQYLIPKENFVVRYLYYAIKAMHLEKYYMGAAIPHIYFKDYKNEKLKLRSIEEQNQIVDVLDKIEQILYKHKQQLKKLDELIKARFVEMFGVPILNTKQWAEAVVGEIANEVRYGTSKPAVENGKYPYLRMNNLTLNGHLDLNDLKYIDIPKDEVEKCVVRKGDILFNRTNSAELVGKTALFDLDQDMVIAGYIIRVRLNDKILPEFFVQYMNTDALKSLLKGMAKGAVNQANINAKELQGIKVYLPPLELQNEFIKFKIQVDKSKVVIEKSIKELETLQASLMQKYFS